MHRYETPRVTDYGTLLDVTATVHPMIGMAGSQDLSFSSPGGGAGAAQVVPGSPGHGGGPTGDPGPAPHGGVVHHHHHHYNGHHHHVHHHAHSAGHHMHAAGPGALAAAFGTLRRVWRRSSRR